MLVYFLATILTVFEIEWLCQVCLCSVVAISISRGVTLAEAPEDYGDNPLAISERTLHAIFQVAEVSPQDQQGQDDARLLQRLRDYTAPQWLERVKELLMQGSNVRIRAHHIKKEDCRGDILCFIQ